MFNSLQPPMLVHPIAMRHSTLFPSHEGYCVHFLDEEQALVSYKDGWAFPLSVQQQRFVSGRPFLLLKESGCITSSGSTFSKGYAHQFCQENGREAIFFKRQAIFPDQPDTMWMLIPNTVTMIWLQYGNKNQYCGDSGYEMERIYYGKLLIRSFIIEEDFAPKMGKDAADPVLCAKQYRVYGKQVFMNNWSLKDKDTHEYLTEILRRENLEQYQTAVTIALKRAGYIS